MAAATAVMGVAVWFAAHAVGSATGAGALLRLVVGTAVGVAVYGAAVVVLRVDELVALVGRRRPRDPRGASTPFA
jgi:hypothetical protein